MAIIQIRNFGGLAPRVSPRALGPDAAQQNKNLLATATEFRPLQGDKSVGTATDDDIKTLYRLSRDSSGDLRTDDTSGWIAETRDKNYVKGQLNDDATARTLVAFNDGEDKPLVIDATMTNLATEARLLGVPPPAKPSVGVNEIAQFTMDDALEWLDANAIPAIAAAVRSVLNLNDETSRYANGAPVAGAYSMHGMVNHPGSWWQAVYSMSVPNAEARNLRWAPGWMEDGGVSGFAIELMPYWGVITSKANLKAALQLIESPKTGSQAFTSEQIDALADRMEAAFDPDGPGIQDMRQQLDKVAQDYVALFDASGAANQSTKPVEPTPPTGPRLVKEVDQSGQGDVFTWVTDPDWVQYDADMITYRENLAAWQEAGGLDAVGRSELLAQAEQLRAKAERLSNEIEAEFFRRMDDLEETVRAAANGENLLGDMDLDPDRIVESRFYIVTFVNDWGWESAPSPVSDMLEVDQNDTVTVSRPAMPANRDIQLWRVYRSNVGTATASFQFVDEMPANQTTFVDQVKGEALGEPCPTLTWAEPPFRIDSMSAAAIKPAKGNDPYLRGIVGMPNGIVAGYVDNFVAFCHPYHPYAWPVEYQITTEWPIVGLGVFGQTLFVGTMGNPYLMSGADSASMSAEKLPYHQACVSRRSIVGVGAGVIYASPDGLCMASPQGVEVLTAGLFSREDWQALNPAGIIAAAHENVYYFWTGSGDAWALDFAARKLTRVDAVAEAVHVDMLTDHIYAVASKTIKKLFDTGRRTGIWKSGKMVFERQAPLAWLQVDGTQDGSTTATVRWYGDGTLRHTATVKGIEPMRLPPGRYLEHEVEVESAARITKVTLAGSTAELQGLG